MNELALFNDLFDDFGDDNYMMPSINLKKVFQAPKVDIKEHKDAYTLTMDLPGKTDKDVNIELNNNVLTISSEKTEDKKEAKKEEKGEKKDDGKWLVKERSYHKFSRSFSLPDDVEADKVNAEVKNGVLTVNMPRKSLPAPKHIAIKSA